MKKSLIIMLVVIGLMCNMSHGIYYCGDCADTWSSSPTVPGDTCRMWVDGFYVEQYRYWDTTTTSTTGSEYLGGMKTFDDFRCMTVPAGVNPYKINYATTSNSGTVKSVSHSWSAGIEWTPVKDVLSLSAGCSGTNSSSWHCDEGCAWSQDVYGYFKDGEKTAMYPRWRNTTITATGPVTQYAYEGGPLPFPYTLWRTKSLGTKTATKIDRAIAATFKAVKESASCTACGAADEWCNGTSCDTTCCSHNQ